MAVVMIGAAFALAGSGVAAWIGLALFAVQLGWQVRRLNISDPALCLRVFRSNREAGLILFAGLVIDGGYVFDYQPKSTRRSWAQESFNFPGGKTDPSDITGSVAAKKEEAPPKPAVSAPETARPPDGTVLYPDPAQPVSASERALLERARALVPLLAERAPAATAARQLPAETIAEYHAAGILRILQPRRFGGMQAGSACSRGSSRN